MFSLMGNCCAACLSGRQPARKLTLAIVGLDNAGKTVTTKGLQGEPLDSVAPTIGFSSADFRFEKYQVTLFDLGGGKRIRNIWQQYLFEIYGLVYVVDSSEVERMDECREVLAELLEHPKVAGKPVLLLANKQDKAGALDEIDICESLSLEEIVNMNKCPCRVEMCAAILGKGKKLDRAISAGMSWLLETISVNFEKLDERVQRDVKDNQEKMAAEKKERAERVRKQREARDREKEAARARGELPDSEEDEPDFNIADPFKKLDYNEVAKKEKMMKDKKKKKKELESAKILSEDSDDSIVRARRHSNEDLHRSFDNGRVKTGKARTPRGTRTRSRSPSPNGRLRARSLSPPLRRSNGFDPYHTNSKEKLVGQKSSPEDDDNRQLPWLKNKNHQDRLQSPDDDNQVPPRGRGLSPLAPIDSMKKKKKKKSKRNQIVPGAEDEDHEDTPRRMENFARAAPLGWNTPPLTRSSHKTSRSPRLEPLAEPEHEMDSFSSKWGLVDELPEVHHRAPHRTRPNTEYDDDIVT